MSYKPILLQTATTIKGEPSHPPAKRILSMPYGGGATRDEHSAELNYNQIDIKAMTKDTYMIR